MRPRYRLIEFVEPIRGTRYAVQRRRLGFWWTCLNLEREHEGRMFYERHLESHDPPRIIAGEGAES